MKPVPHAVSEFAYEKQKGKWKYVLTSDFTLCFEREFWGQHEFLDQNKKPRVVTDGRYWTILKNYAWDGSSMVPDFWFTRPASAFHDSCGQFRHLKCVNSVVDGAKWNQLYADIMLGCLTDQHGWLTRAHVCSVANLYLFGLTLGNPFYSRLGMLCGSKTEGSCRNHHT